MRLYIYPPRAVTVTTPPVGFILDGVDTTVSQDTSTPGNSTPLPVIQLDSSGNPATPLTDTQLRATPVPVSGPLTDTQLRASAVPVSGPLTDTQLRASAVPVSDSASQTILNEINTDLGLQTSPAEPNPANNTTVIGGIKGINSNLQSIDGKTPALVGGRVPVDGSGVTQPISASSLPLPTGASTLAEQQAQSTLIGAVNETAPATDTASSGLNGRLQRIAQRLTSLIGILPAALGQNTSAGSLAVVLSSQQETLLSDIESNTNPKIIDSMSQSTTTTSATLTAPAGSRGYTIQNSTRASGALRYTKSGGGASATVGFLLEPGQSTSYQDGASSLDVFAVDGTAIDACVIWYV